MNKLEDRVNHITEAYRLFYEAAFGSFHLAIYHKDFGTIEGINRVQHELEHLTTGYEPQFSMIVSSACDSTLFDSFREASQLIKLSELTREQRTLSEQLAISERERLLNALIDRVNSDVAQLKKAYIRASLLNQSGMIGVGGKDGIVEQESTYRMDVTGKRWKVENYVHIETNWVLHDLYNVHMVYLLSLAGEHQACIKNGDELTPFNLDDFDDLRETVFHPRSKATVAPLSLLTP